MLWDLFKMGCRGLWSVVRFTWPIVLYLMIDSYAFDNRYWLSGGREYTAFAISPILLCGLAAALIAYDVRFKVIAVLSAIYALYLTAFGEWGLAQIASWAVKNLSESGWAATWKMANLSMIIARLLAFGAGVAVLVYAFPGAVNLIRKMNNGGGKALKFEDSTSGLHGSSRFATGQEIAALATKGTATTNFVVLGQTNMTVDKKANGKDLVKLPIEAHAVTFAPSRTGKGVSLIHCQTLTYKGPVVVIDPKAEALLIAGRARSQMGRRVCAIDPFDICGRMAKRASAGAEIFKPEKRASYNPLDFIVITERAVKGNAVNVPSVADIDTLLDCILPRPRDEGGTGIHFWTSATTLMRGIIYQTLCRFHNMTGDRDPANLVTVRGTLQKIAGNGEDRVKTYASMLNVGGPAYDAVKLIEGMGDKELGSVLSTAQNALGWLGIEELREAIETSAFSLDELLDDKIDIFVCIPPERLEQSRLLLRLFAALPVAAATRERAKERILIILDEAPLVGRLDAIVQAYRVAAGMNLSIWIFAQTVGGLEEAYGKETARDLIGNAEIVGAFGLGQTNLETCEWLSKALGDKTVITENTNTSGGSSAKVTDVFSTGNTSSGSSRQESKRALMLASDISQMPAQQMIWLTRSAAIARPMLLWQARYYARPEFEGLHDRNPYRG
ncbi:type IV secretory system conjugative DNA transfer family protein [Bradyrhizobium elkanii]|uniref:type IV secretory system conjugative DNA transfer family protein n=1 Tax=Bradyrhizobium elkanii TaxID=29448 RepID=UPI0035156C70